MAISKRQIHDAETAYANWIANRNVKGFDDAENKKYADAAIRGKLKWMIEDDRIIPLAPDDMGYNYDTAFNTPQDAEHFTPGYGNEPGRGTVGKFVGSIVAPISQHQITDPVRRQMRDPVADVTQDALSTSRYLLPVVSQFAKRSPLGAALMAGSYGTGAGLVNKAVSEMRDDAAFGETPENILLTAAAAAGGAGASKALSEENVRKRQLVKLIERNLGIKKGSAGWDQGLEARIEDPLKAQSIQVPEYTYGDYRRHPLTEFDANTGAQELPVRFKRPPNVFKSETSPIPVKREPGTIITDEIATRFINELGLNRGDVDINEVKAWLTEAWLRPLSDKGRMFYPTKDTRMDVSKKRWTDLKANEKSQFAADMLTNQAFFEDPVVNSLWQKAKAEYAARWRKIKGKTNTPIVSRPAYEKLGQLRLPITGINVRPFVQGGAMILVPMATEAFGKYLLNRLPTGGNND